MDSNGEQGLTHLMSQESSSVEAKTNIPLLGAAGIGLVSAISGAALMVLWSPWTQELPATVSVTSCSDQYETISASLAEMVHEGIAAGQSPTGDLSWITSINSRLGALEEQREALQLECLDGAAER